MIDLPHKLSDLAQIALDDITAISEQPLYKIHMERWHEPRLQAGLFGSCFVCVAGAIMAQRLDRRPTEDIFNPRAFASFFGEGNARALLAVDCLRRGQVQNALNSLEHGVDAWATARLDEKVDSHPVSRELPEYYCPLWDTQMLELIRDLKAAGL